MWAVTTATVHIQEANGLFILEKKSNMYDLFQMKTLMLCTYDFLGVPTRPLGDKKHKNQMQSLSVSVKQKVTPIP